MQRISLLALLGLAACGGSVSLEEVESFGGVASAVWYYDDDNDTHQIRLTNVPGACAKFQAEREADEAWSDAVRDLGFNDLDEVCEVLHEPTIEAARAKHALYYEGAHHLAFWVRDGLDTEPDDDEYEVGGDPGVEGTLYYHENSPYAAILEQYDPDEDDELCGVDEDDAETDGDAYYLSDGELVIDEVVDEKTVRGSFEGELEEPGGKGAGDIRFDFVATWCEVG